MPSSAARFVTLLLPLFAALVRAVSLSDFTPRVDDLSSECDTVYNHQIKDCDASDLSTGENCSVACISGLLLIAQQVKAACANDDVAETSIIGVFQLGKGPETLCSNIAATTIGSGQTSTTESTTSSFTEQSSTMELTSTTAETTETAKSKTTAASTTRTTASTTTSATQESSTAVETTAASTTASAPSSTKTEAAATTSSGAEDLASLNEGSGGGSPFDHVAGSAPSRATISTWLMGAALGLCGVLVQLLS